MSLKHSCFFISSLFQTSSGESEAAALPVEPNITCEARQQRLTPRKMRGLKESKWHMGENEFLLLDLSRRVFEKDADSFELVSSILLEAMINGAIKVVLQRHAWTDKLCRIVS